jgi:endonuclease III
MPTTQAEENEQQMKQIIRILKKTYPAAHCALNHTNPLELLIATMLSAQCTDERVNLVTATLFRKYRQAEDYVKVERTELERDLSSINFYRNKAKNIQAACQIIAEQHQARVPETMEELLTLPGVARKTANVVLGNAFGVAAGIVVDTHVARLSQRLGLTKHEQPEKIERDLLSITPRKDWIILPHLLISHGRALCKARNPQCQACPLEALCPASLLKQ